MLDVIERTINFLAVGAKEGTADTGDGTAKYAHTKLLTEKSVSFHGNTIHSITDTKGDYTIEFSKPGNATHFTINLTIYAGDTIKEYVVNSPGQGFIFIRTESDLVSYMAK